MTEPGQPNFDIPMCGSVLFNWNLGQDEAGYITGQIDVVVNGERRAANIIGFAKGIRHFDDDMLEQATLLTVAKVWRDDFKPRLHKALYTAFYEMREREGGFVELPEDDEPDMEIEST
jgi:hypothetical protein